MNASNSHNAKLVASHLRDFAEFLPEAKRADFNATVDDLLDTLCGPADDGWMRADEQWPQFFEPVLLSCGGELLSTGCLVQNGGGVPIFRVDAESPSDGSRWIVTHWKRLPKAPSSDATADDGK